MHKTYYSIGIFLFIFCFCLVSLGWAQQIPVKAGTESDIVLHQPKERDIFTVAFIADRTGGWPEDIKYLRRAVYEINQLNPDFAIHIGDMVEGYTRKTHLWMQECEEFKSAMKQLRMPWYPAVGNHDVISGSRDADDRTYEELYQKHFGPLYYSFDYKNSHFICLYTDEALQSRVTFSDAQLQWLENDLKSTDKTNIFIYMHKPVWDEYYKQSGWLDKIHPMLKEYPVRAVIAGHYHNYRKCPSKDGIQYYILGATGGNLYEEVELAGRFHHYNILRIESDTFTMGVVKLGNVESNDYILEEDAARIYQITSQRGDTRVEGWLWQPVRREITGTLSIRIANPLDVEMPVKLHLDGNSKHWKLVSAPSKLVIAPNSFVSVEVSLHSRKVLPKNVVPPKLIVEYFYTTKQNKVATVPFRLWVPLRLSRQIHQKPVEITIDGLLNEPEWKHATTLYAKSWTPSYYEREGEPTSTIHIAADKSYLYFCAVVPDDVYEYYREDNRSDRLLSDYIVFTTADVDISNDDDVSKTVLIFPFNDAHQAFRRASSFPKPSELEPIEGVQYASSKHPEKRMYICEGKIAYEQLFGTTDVANREFLFNVEVVDNDQNAFTYLKSWAYAQDKVYWGILRFSSQ